LKCLIKLSIHSLAFDKNPKSDCLWEDLTLDHAVVGLNGSLHVLEVDAHVDEAVEEHIVNCDLTLDQFLDLAETLL